MSDTEQQVDIKTSSYRVVHESPGHVTYGVWINGAKAGDIAIKDLMR